MNINFFFAILFVGLLYNSCSLEEQSSILSISETKHFDLKIQGPYVNGIISGDKAPYVGEGIYTYDLILSNQSAPIGIRVSSVGGEARFKDPNTNRFVTNLTYILPKNTTKCSFNVLWTKEASGAVIMVRPELNSTIQMTADLKDINVKIKSMEVNAPPVFELGTTFALWCNYPLNNDTQISWIYDKDIFSEISQSASVVQGQLRLELKSIKSFTESSIRIEIFDSYINSIGAKEYFLCRRGSKDYNAIGPQIVGKRNIEQYNKYTYSLNDSKAHSFSWTGDNIKIISGQNSSMVTIMPINEGTSRIKVTYKYGQGVATFENEYLLKIFKTSMKLVGPDVICSDGLFTIDNFPIGATVDWVTSNGLFSALNQTKPSITLSNIALPGGSSIYTTLNATVYIDGISVVFFKPLIFNMSGIQEENHNINGYLTEDGGQCELSPVPEGASDFHWSIDNGWNVDMQGYYFTTFSNNGKPFTGSVWVTVDFTDACGQRGTIYKKFEIGSGSYSQTYRSTLKKYQNKTVSP